METHMLDSMGHARHIIFIAEASDVHIQGSTGLVRRRIMYQADLKHVAESDDLVGAIIKRGLLELVCDQLGIGLTVAGHILR